MASNFGERVLGEVREESLHEVCRYPFDSLLNKKKKGRSTDGIEALA